MKNFILLSLILIFTFLLSACGGENATQGSQEDASREAPAGPNVVGQEVTYSTDSTTMKGYLAYDANLQGPRPGILVVHEWWGHNDYARKRADMLAEMGYIALAVDMYGDGQQAAHPEDAQKFAMSVMGNLDAAKARFEAAMQTLEENENTDPEAIAAIGYCFGGSVVLSMANAGYDLDGVAAFHSGVQLPVMPDASTLKAQVLVCNGADDPFISPESVDAFKQAMDQAEAKYKYIAYPGAVHAFTNPGADTLGQKFSLPLAYNQEADEQSWAELEKFLAEIF